MIEVETHLTTEGDDTPDYARKLHELRTENAALKESLAAVTTGSVRSGDCNGRSSCKLR